MSAVCCSCLGSGLQKPVSGVSTILSCDGVRTVSEGESCVRNVGSCNDIPLLNVSPPPVLDIEALSRTGSLDWYKSLWVSYYAAFQTSCRSVSSIYSSASEKSSAPSSRSEKEQKPSLKERFSVKRDKLFSSVGERRKVIDVSIGKVADASAPLSEDQILSYGDGYCYLRVVTAVQAERVAKQLGPWPAIGTLIRGLRPSDVLPSARLRGVGVVYSVGKVHVLERAAEHSFYSMLCTLRGLVGTTYGLLQVTGKDDAYDVGASFGMHIGGSGSVGGSKASGDIAEAADSSFGGMVPLTASHQVVNQGRSIVESGSLASFFSDQSDVVSVSLKDLGVSVCTAGVSSQAAAVNFSGDHYAVLGTGQVLHCEGVEIVGNSRGIVVLFPGGGNLDTDGTVDVHRLSDTFILEFLLSVYSGMLPVMYLQSPITVLRIDSAASAFKGTVVYRYGTPTVRSGSFLVGRGQDELASAFEWKLALRPDADLSVSGLVLKAGFDVTIAFAPRTLVVESDWTGVGVRYSVANADW